METRNQRIDRLYIEAQTKREIFWNAHNEYVSGSFDVILKEKRDVAKDEWTRAEHLFDKELWSR